MAMRAYSKGEFEDELIRRGCEKVSDEEFGSLWRRGDGRVFTVSYPEEEGDRYPDFMLDDLIRTHDLPSAPKR